MKGLLPRVRTDFEAGPMGGPMAGDAPQKGLQDSLLPVTLLPNT